jgi:uncharacterized protein (DUF1684 family)
LSCSQDNRSKISSHDHAEEVESWHKFRVESLKKEDGWLNIIGLYWLEHGNNTFGSDVDSDVLIEDGEAPANLGTFTLEGGKVFFIPQVEGIFFQDKAVSSQVMILDTGAYSSPMMTYNTLKWNVIKRGEAYGIRLRNTASAAVTGFTGIDRYPVDLNWMIAAKFIAHNPKKLIDITNVLGQTTANPSPGYVEFERHGKRFKIDALEEEDELFLILADETSGRETYGGGRYMYVKKPEGSDGVLLDFNKAYNPPCVFTPYATCPLPPRQNMLDLAITAGEKNFGSH